MPPGSDLTPAEADTQNDSTGDQYYLFGPDQLPIGPDKQPLRDRATTTRRVELQGACCPTTTPAPGPPHKYAKDTECTGRARGARPGRPAGRLARHQGAAGHRGRRGRAGAEPAARRSQRFFVIEDDSELNGTDIKNPEQNFDPNTNAPVVTMEFTDKGREAFARVTKRIADARLRDARRLAEPGRADGAARPSSASRSRSTTRSSRWRRSTSSENPEGIDGRTGAADREHRQHPADPGPGREPAHRRAADRAQADLADPGLGHARPAGARPGPASPAAAGLALTILFLLVFYRVLGLVATVALLIYAVLLFALVKLIPITLTLPGIAGMVLTLAVAADANIVMFERIKEEVRTGQIDPGRHLHRLHEGAADDHRRERRDDRRGVHPVHARHRGRQGLRVHARCRHASCRCSPPCSPPRRSSARWRARGCCGVRARSAWARRAPAAGASTSWASRAGSSRSRARSSRPARSRSPALGINFGIDFESGTRITTPLERQASVDQVRDTLDPLGYADAKIQEVDDPELGNNVVQIAVPQLEPGAGAARSSTRSTSDFGVTSGDFSSSSIGPTFGEQIARTARDRGDRVAAPDLALHRLPLRVQVRRAGADRAGARPADHGGRVRPHRPGGDDVDGRGAAHHPGLLALRHDHRVRPNTRERAAHAARHLLPDRQPLDVRGVHPIAGHELRAC